MKIVRAVAWKENLELSKPYTIAYRTVNAVENYFVRLELADGRYGLGAGSPAEFVTGENLQIGFAALNEQLEAIVLEKDIRDFQGILRENALRLSDYPAAQAAIDIALYDLFGKILDVPICRFLGRVHQGLPTSITIGIKSVAETIAEAVENVQLGFRIIKLKTGLDVEKDIEVFAKLRETVGRDIKIRIDANQGYDTEKLLRFVQGTRHLNVEFYEQPFPPGNIDQMLGLPLEIRDKCAADEDLHTADDAIQLACTDTAFGIFNIKLMKCGGIQQAMRISQIASDHNLQVMWGCNDESIISITAALHAALASPATRYLDLDGSLDLARDIVNGGFLLKDGCLYTTDKPGLGVELL